MTAEPLEAAPTNCRKGLIVVGMWVQAAGLFLTALTGQFWWWLAASALLGLGTAMV
jgi:hypothetical protein